MAVLTAAAIKALAVGLASKTDALEVVDSINKGEALAAASSHYLAGAIVATAVSQTTDFGDLLVGDKVVMIPATAGNADFITIATAGDLGQAAVIGNLYLVIRAVSAPTAATLTQ